MITLEDVVAENGGLIWLHNFDQSWIDLACKTGEVIDIVKHDVLKKEIDDISVSDLEEVIRYKGFTADAKLLHRRMLDDGSHVFYVYFRDADDNGCDSVNLATENELKELCPVNWSSPEEPMLSIIKNRENLDLRMSEVNKIFAVVEMC